MLPSKSKQISKQLAVTQKFGCVVLIFSMCILITSCGSGGGANNQEIGENNSLTLESEVTTPVLDDKANSSESSQALPSPTEQANLLMSDLPLMNPQTQEIAILSLANNGNQTANNILLSSADNSKIDVTTPALVNPCSSSLAPGATCNYTVSLGSSNYSSGSTLLTLNYDNPANTSSSQAVNYYNSLAEPMLSTLANISNFTESINTSTTIVFTVQNIANAPLNNVNISLSETLSHALISQTNNCGSTIAAQDTCTINASIAADSYADSGILYANIRGNLNNGTTTKNYSFISKSVKVTIISPTIPITITNLPSPANLIAAQYFQVTVALSGSGVVGNQIISVSNLVALQAAGMAITSSQAANPNTCIISNTVTSCIFTILTRNSALINDYTLNLINTGSLSLGASNINYAIVAAPTLISTIKLPQSGASRSFAMFDDGIYQMGVTWKYSANGVTTPANRFTLGSGTTAACVTDNLTGLMWVKAPQFPSPKPIWESALTYANNLNLCGFTDWRLPNQNELLSLVNYNESNQATWLNSQGFSNVQAVTYWSSSTYPPNLLQTWILSLSTGSSGSGRSSFDTKGTNTVSGIWPVRGSSNGLAKLPKTNQTTTIPLNPAPTGSDGNLIMGTAWPSPRFILGTGTELNCITDKLTGLMWIKAPSLTTSTWANALTSAASLKRCGYSDWRLPNINELRSLVNLSKAVQNTWLQTQGFSNVQSGLYYSSTSDALDTSKTWYVSMSGGTTGSTLKTGSTSYVWPVRGGQ